MSEDVFGATAINDVTNQNDFDYCDDVTDEDNNLGGFPQTQALDNVFRDLNQSRNMLGNPSFSNIVYQKRGY